MIGKQEEIERRRSMPVEETRSILSSGKVKLLRSHELFAGVREVVIEHDGELYRLRPTKKGKLILTK